MFPAEYEDLLADSNPRAFLVLALTLADGAPIAAPVWFLRDGDDLIIYTDPDSTKTKIMRARPRFAAVIMAEANYARYISVRGMASEATEGNLEGWYRQMSRKYENKEPENIVETVFFRLTPEKVSAFDYSDYVV